MSTMKMTHVVVVAKRHLGESWHYPRKGQHEAVVAVLQALKKRDIRYQIRDRKFLRKKLNADLIITVGGDGTLLAASHHSGQIPLLGVNSMPAASTGFFCKATTKTFPQMLDKMIAGTLQPRLLYRIRVKIGKKTIPVFALNDVLFASGIAGDTTRYILQIGQKKEFQKSSGVWVATASGSTAAIYSAGGKKESLRSKRLQYKVREPFRYPKPRYKNLHGFVPPPTKITILSKTDDSMVFLDGPSCRYSVPFGTKVTLQGGVTPLPIFL